MTMIDDHGYALRFACAQTMADTEIECRNGIAVAAGRHFRQSSVSWIVAVALGPRTPDRLAVWETWLRTSPYAADFR